MRNWYSDLRNWYADVRDRYYYEDPEPRRFIWDGAVIGALVVALVWTVASVGGNSSRESTVATNEAQHHSSLTGLDSVNASPADARLDRCREVYDGQRAPLRAADVAMSQWQIHIDAMNKLVLGAITLNQANQFWNQTRVNARAHLHTFDGALRHFKHSKVHCAQWGLKQVSPRLQGCELAVTARNGVLAAARLGLATWAMHFKHMEMLRNGMMSPARATQLWLQSWREGQQEVNRYRTAVHKAHAYAARC